MEKTTTSSPSEDEIRELQEKIMSLPNEEFFKIANWKLDNIELKTGNDRAEMLRVIKISQDLFARSISRVLGKSSPPAPPSGRDAI